MTTKLKKMGSRLMEKQLILAKKLLDEQGIDATIIPIGYDGDKFGSRRYNFKLFIKVYDGNLFDTKESYMHLYGLTEAGENRIKKTKEWKENPIELDKKPFWEIVEKIKPKQYINKQGARKLFTKKGHIVPNVDTITIPKKTKYKHTQYNKASK